MKIINLNELSASTLLTVDSTTITVDSTTITVDTTILTGEEMVFKIIPREYVSEVKLKWWNELKEVAFEEECFTTTDKGYMLIPYTYRDIVEGDSFEITVTDLSDNLLIRFKAYATMQEDLQNYKLNIANNNGIIEF